MHKIQEDILKLAMEQDVSKLTLRETAKAIGKPDISLGLLQYHFDKLENQGLLYIFRKKQIQRFGSEVENRQLTSIPIMGSANCGPASIYSTDVIQGYLKLSRNIIKKSEGLIALIASGDSMNDSKVQTPTPGVKAPINDGDIVIIDTNNKSITEDYVLSVIDGMANIKRLKKRSYDIALLSESKSIDLYPPIIITQHDNYMVGGRVLMVCQS